MHPQPPHCLRRRARSLTNGRASTHGWTSFTKPSLRRRRSSAAQAHESSWSYALVRDPQSRTRSTTWRLVPVEQSLGWWRQRWGWRSTACLPRSRCAWNASLLTRRRADWLQPDLAAGCVGRRHHAAGCWVQVEVEAAGGRRGGVERRSVAASTWPTCAGSHPGDADVAAPAGVEARGEAAKDMGMRGSVDAAAGRGSKGIRRASTLGGYVPVPPWRPRLTTTTTSGRRRRLRGALNALKKAERTFRVRATPARGTLGPGRTEAAAQGRPGEPVTAEASTAEVRRRGGGVSGGGNKRVAMGDGDGGGGSGGACTRLEAAACATRRRRWRSSEPRRRACPGRRDGPTTAFWSQERDDATSPEVGGSGGGGRWRGRHVRCPSREGGGAGGGASTVAGCHTAVAIERLARAATSWGRRKREGDGTDGAALAEAALHGAAPDDRRPRPATSRTSRRLARPRARPRDPGLTLHLLLPPDGAPRAAGAPYGVMGASGGSCY